MLIAVPEEPLDPFQLGQRTLNEQRRGRIGTVPEPRDGAVIKRLLTDRYIDLDIKPFGFQKI